MERPQKKRGRMSLGTKELAVRHEGSTSYRGLVSRITIFPRKDFAFAPIVSKKVATRAVVRNAIKRRIRSAVVRWYREHDDAKIGMLVIPTPKTPPASVEDFYQDLCTIRMRKV
jgi:RNase P protein component